MALLKWKIEENIWLTFYWGAFQNIKADLKNIILSINNMAATIRMRCRRDYNLSDIYDAADGRTNLGVIGDCSALPRAPHHHDSRYIPLIEEERDRAMAEEEAIWTYLRSLRSCNCPDDCGKERESEDEGGNESGGAEEDWRFIETINVETQFRGSRDEELHFYQTETRVYSDVNSLKFIFDGKIKGQGAFGVRCNGQVQMQWFSYGGHNYTAKDSHAELGPYPAINNGTNTIEIGLDGDNSIGIELWKPGTLQVWGK